MTVTHHDHNTFSRLGKMEVVKADGLPARLANLKRKRSLIKKAAPSDDPLRWRPVQRSHLQAGLDDAVLSFDEIDGVDVEFEQLPDGGRIAKFSVGRCYTVSKSLGLRASSSVV